MSTGDWKVLTSRRESNADSGRGEFSATGWNISYFRADLLRTRLESLGEGQVSEHSEVDCVLLNASVKVNSMAQTAINASPFQCRWISRGTEMRMEQWTYAICLRCRDHARVVSEEECGRCMCWESPTEHASHVGR
jgi:hypothetical protein